MDYKKREYLSAFFIVSIIGLLFVTLSGSVFSGYHFMDCSGFTVIKDHLSSMSWIECGMKYFMNEGIRFRPAWHFNTAFETWLWGDNMLLQGVWQIFQIIIAAFLIYLLGRRIKWTHWASLLFAGLSLIGTQSAIFYQTLAIETPALVLLLLSWHFLLSYVNRKHKTAYYSGFVITSILIALMKENFILILPAGYVFYCMIYEEKYRTGFAKTLLHTWKTGVLLMFITISCLVAVVVYAGTDFGYAGVDYHSGFAPYIKAAVYLYGISGVLLLAVPGTIYLLWKKKITGKDWIYPVLLFLAITIPQLIIYAKSNIIDRYLIPATVGCAYFSIFIYGELKKNDRPIKVQIWKKISLAVGLIIMLLSCYIAFNETLRQQIVEFAIRLQGKQLQEMTSVSSMQYLSSTILTMDLTVLLGGCILFAWGCMKNRHHIIKLSQLYISGLLLFLLMSGGLAFASHQRYAMRGNATENFLNTIINHTVASDTVLIAGNPLVEIEGTTGGISVYLHKYDRHNLYICPVIRTDTEKELSSSLSDYYQHKDINAIAEKKNIKAIAIFPGLEHHFEQANPWFDAAVFNRHEFTGNYVVFIRKDL
jgi:hypothetical protein